MFTTHSACPTTDNPACVPGSYQVQRPPAVEPVPCGGFACKLSTATETARAKAAKSSSLLPKN
jgi:hypothetical protein